MGHPVPIAARLEAKRCPAAAGLEHISNGDDSHAGHGDLVPSSFSEVPHLMAHATRRSLVLTSVAPPDRHGYFSLAPHAEYVAPTIGDVPFFLEVNQRIGIAHPRFRDDLERRAREIGYV